MHIIPVLDLMNGQVVHGIQGERSRYRPVESCLTPHSDPLSVARAFQSETGCREFYIADLDALQGRGDHRDQIRELSDRLSVELWVDAGVTDADSAKKVRGFGAHRVIICSESLPNRTALTTMTETVLSVDSVFSIDIVRGHVMSKADFLKRLPPLDAVEMVAGQGWKKFILLTLDHVGTGSGPDWDLLESARRRFPHLSLFAGGGIHTPEEMVRLAALGIDGVLVATSLHKGWITRRHIEAMG